MRIIRANGYLKEHFNVTSWIGNLDPKIICVFFHVMLPTIQPTRLTVFDLFYIIFEFFMVFKKIHFTPEYMIIHVFYFEFYYSLLRD